MWTNSAENCPQWETRLKAPLLPDSCCALHHFPQSLCSLNLPCLLSVFIHRSGRVSLFISPLYFLSSRFARTHTAMHAHIHFTRRPQKWEPVAALEWESVDERRPICDWMTEWLKEWRAKAVKLSVSLHRSRRQEPTLRRESSSQIQSYRVRSTRIGIRIQMHSYNHYFWCYLWDEDDKWQRSCARVEVMSTGTLYVSLSTQSASWTLWNQAAL